MKALKMLYLVIITLLIIPVGLFADNKPDSGTLFEVGFLPFGSGQNIIFSQINVKSILSENATVRLGVNFDYDSDQQKDAYNGWMWGDKTTLTSSLIGLQGGYEIHTIGTDKLSPYFGGLVGVNLFSAKEEFSDTTGYKYTVTGGQYNGPRSYTSILAKALLGCDFYFAQNIYLGMEVNYGLDLRNYPKVKMKETDDGISNTTLLDDKRTLLGFGKAAEGVMRLGFKF